MIQEIVRRFQNAHGGISRGPHTQVSHNELFLIEVIGDHGPQMMKDAAIKLGIAVNTLTGIVDQLEGKGFISRSRSQTDRRVVFVMLTPAGKRIYKSAYKAKHEFHRANLASLTPLERGTLLDLFKKMASAGAGNAESPQPRQRKSS
jgi:DNA-binding MarR family transcriptional regulator